MKTDRKTKMVKITNGVNTFEVPTGAYRNTFKKLGYNLVSEPKEATTTSPDASGAKVEELQEDEFAELMEKPIAQWNKSEVKAFAAAKGIDLAGTKTIDEAKERIKEKIGL